MAFRTADPAGSRRLARSRLGLYQGPRRGLTGSVHPSRLDIMPFVRLWRALFSLLSSSPPLCRPAPLRRASATRQYAYRRAAWHSSTSYPSRPTSSKKGSPPTARRTPSSSRSGCSSRTSRASCLPSAVAFRPRLSEINASARAARTAARRRPERARHRHAERQALTAEKAEINAVLGLAESLSIRVNGLIEKIGLMRSELFRNVLTKRYALTDAFDSELLDDVHDEYHEFLPRRLVVAEIRLPVQVPVDAGGGLFRACRCSGAAFRRPAAVRERLRRRSGGGGPVLSQPLSVAFWSTLAADRWRSARSSLSTLFFFNYFNVLRGDIGVFLDVAVRRHRHRFLRQPAGQRRTRAEAAELAADPDRFAHRAAARAACDGDGRLSSAPTISWRSSTTRWARRSR